MDFYSGYINYFLVEFRNFSLSFVTIPVAPVITGIIIHTIFHIRRISQHALFYLLIFSPSFCVTYESAGISTSISLQDFCFLFLVIISGHFSITSLSINILWVCNAIFVTLTSFITCTLN